MIQDKKKKILYNTLFVLVLAGILIFLFNAPPETTAKLPVDKIHSKFYNMKKKDAEKKCNNCHASGKQSPLPEDHPPKPRCLFCHKKDMANKP